MKTMKRENRLKSKLRSRAGETIGETLVALLISALALTMLAGAISAAANMINRSETGMKAYYDGLNVLGNPSSGHVTVSLSDGSKLNKNDIGSAKYAVNGAFPNKPVISYCATVGG